MTIGQYRTPVTIQQPASGQDSIGQPDPTWTDLASVYADVRHLSGLETIRGGAETAVGKVSIRIRYRDDVTTKMRVTVGSVSHGVTAVLPDARRKHVDLVCETVA